MMKNNTPGDVIRNTLMATLGLFFFSFGVYLTIQADIGVAPWDILNLGLSKTFGIKYGTANIAVSLLIVVIDILLREQIGIGMFLDAILVGKFVDLFNWIDIVPYQHEMYISLIVMTIGMFILGFSQVFYMSAALGCGPRDTLLVGLKRRLDKIPIGAISVAILTVATLIGWKLGGPLGIGTLICAFLEGPIMQGCFAIVKFIPTDVKHQNIFQSVKVLKKTV